MIDNERSVPEATRQNVQGRWSGSQMDGGVAVAAGGAAIAWSSDC